MFKKKRLTIGVFIFLVFNYFSISISQPYLIVPSDNSNNISCETYFSWQSQTFWNNYQLQVSTNINFSSTVISVTISASNYTVQYLTLNGNTNYYWRVRAHNINSGNWTGYSVPYEFRTSIRPTVELVFPLHQSTLSSLESVQFSWTLNSSATEYQLYIADNPSFNNQIHYYITNNHYTWGNAIPGTTYYWRVRPKGISLGIYTAARSFNISPIGIQQISSEVPYSYKLHNNYPNPFNSKTIIKFDVAKQSFISLKIFNILGYEIENLFENNLTAGTYLFDWEAENYSSGIYFCVYNAPGIKECLKIILIK